MAHTWITKVNNVDTVDAAHVNDLQTLKADNDGTDDVWFVRVGANVDPTTVAPDTMYAAKYKDASTNFLAFLDATNSHRVRIDWGYGMHLKTAPTGVTFPNMDSISLYNDGNIRAGEALWGGYYLHSYGDSIMQGGGVGYIPNWIADRKGYVLTDHSWGGTQIQDHMDAQLHATTVVAGMNSIWIVGLNDMRFYGNNSVTAGYLKDSIKAGLAWLAIPADKKITSRSTAVTYAGTWAQNGQIRSYSSELNATATFSLYGRTILIEMLHVEDVAENGTFSVTIDGALFGNYTTPHSVVCNSAISYHSFLIRAANLSDGAHTVVIKVTSNAVGNVFFEWAAGLGAYADPNGPNVWCANCLRLPVAGYPLYAPFDQGSDAAVSLYNKIILEAVRDLAIDNLNVMYVDASSNYDPVTDCSVDNVHPNITGYSNILDSFLSAMNFMCMPRDRSGAWTTGLLLRDGMPTTEGVLFAGVNGQISSNATAIKWDVSDTCLELFRGVGAGLQDGPRIRLMRDWSGGGYGSAIYDGWNGSSDVLIFAVTNTLDPLTAGMERMIIDGNANIGISQTSFDATGKSVLAIKNGTAPAAHIDNAVEIYSVDSSDSAATLGLMLEQQTEAIGTFTPSDKIKIKINGTEYWIQLDAV
jgi:hypothetical protein